MVGRVMVVAAAVAICAVPARAQEGGVADRLYGRVTTAGGSVHEGFLRWDRNEVSWVDVLNGSKEIPWEHVREAERLDARRWEDERRERSVEILGLRISWDGDEEDYPNTATSGIRFGHVRTLEVLGRDRARVTLKSGEEIELSGGSTDLGSGFRGLVVDEPGRGGIELDWRDLETVEFLPVPARARPTSERLYGTLRTRGGETFTGFVAWDVDEVLGTDILDGEERGRDRDVPFANIGAIERSGSSGARVVLRNGEEFVLRGTNDVNDGNRGISVSDAALGQVTVPWDEFDEVTFDVVPAGAARYEAFDGGYPLRGTVETRDGESFEGWIRWDNDEAWSWELLDGRVGDVDFDIEMGRIASIRPRGSWGSEVTLHDGRVFELEGSNDVDDGNKGIFVTFENGETVLVRWDDLDEVRFDRP